MADTGGKTHVATMASFAGSQPLKKRAFKPPSSVDKHVQGIETLTKLSERQQPAAIKRRRLLVCPALVTPESQPESPSKIAKVIFDARKIIYVTKVPNFLQAELTNMSNRPRRQ